MISLTGIKQNIDLLIYVLIDLVNVLLFVSGEFSFTALAAFFILQKIIFWIFEYIKSYGNIIFAKKFRSSISFVLGSLFVLAFGFLCMHLAVNVVLSLGDLKQLFVWQIFEIIPKELFAQLGLSVLISLAGAALFFASKKRQMQEANSALILATCFPVLIVLPIFIAGLFGEMSKTNTVFFGIALFILLSIDKAVILWARRLWNKLEAKYGNKTMAGLSNL